MNAHDSGLQTLAGLIGALTSVLTAAEAPPHGSPISTLGTVEAFPPIEARYVRMTILKTTADIFPILNEVEIHTAEPQPRNVALAANGAKASASATRDAAWSVEYLNDGLSTGWWAGQAGTDNWIEIELAKTEVIDRIVWSRSRAEPQRIVGIWSGTPIDYRFEVAVAPGQWRQVASSRDHPPFATADEFAMGADVAGTLHGPILQPLVNPRVELPMTNSVRTSPEYRVDHWGEDNEVLQSTVTAMMETPDGYLWIGTALGLLRFDGDHFETFNRDNTPALNPPAVSSLNVDPQGRLLVLLGESGTTGNLVLYDCGRFRRLDVGGAWVRTVFTDSEGRFWGVTSRGVLPWKGDGFDLGAGTTDLLSRIEDSYNVTPDYRSNFWVNVGTRIGTLEQGRFVPLRDKADLPLEFGSGVNSPVLVPRPDGLIWVLEGGAMGETARAPERWRFLRPDRTLTESKPLPWVVEFRTVRSDRFGNLWICSPRDGLFRLSADGAHYEVYTEAEGLTRREVQITYEDREGNIWVGGWRGGLDRLRKPPFQTIAAAAGIGAENVYSLAPAREGGVWIGTHSRSNYLWQAGKTYLHQGSSPHSWAVLEDRTGVLWNGNYNDGLRRLPPGGIERFYSPEAGGHRYTFALLEDRSGRVWAGGQWGLSCYDQGKMSDFLPPLFDKPAFEWVNALAQGGDGAIWLGTKLGFLHRFQNGEFTTFLKSGKDTQFPVCALYVHRPDELWMARFGFGLSRLKDGQFSDYTPAQGLPTSTLNGILDDGRGFLWLTSKQGVFRISKADFDRFAEHPTAGVRWERFTQKDGLPSVGCQGEQNKPSLCQTPDGRIWVPTLGGVGVIDPATLTDPLPPAPAVIEEVLLYRAGSPPLTLLAEGEFNPATPLRLTVPAGRKNLVIHYTGIDLTDPKKVRFQYRLAGLDHDWVEAENNRSAIYAALPPGAYQFEVIAINHRGIPSSPATLALHVLPFWWETWTFRGLVAAVFLLAGPLYYLRRVRHLERERAKQADFTRRLIAREEAERKRIAHEIHDVLGHDLLLLQNNAIQGAKDPAAVPTSREQFGLISGLAARTLEESRGITYRLRPVELERLGFSHALEAMLAKVAATAGLQVFKEVEDLTGVLSAELQLYVYRLVQEGLNNVLKHAHASTVMLEIKRDGDCVTVRLEDNGVGFDPTTVGAAGGGGLGLAGMEERVKLIGGTFELASLPGRGTRIQAGIPLSPRE
jgi:signal transduction histidine kinase/streptogramin lyase